MEYVSLALSYCADIVCQDFLLPPPICKFSLYWRDNVMLVGLIASIVGFVASIFAKSAFFICLFLITTGVLLFGMYYVSRYAELKEMEEQLKDLKEQIGILKDLNAKLDFSIQTFQVEVSTLQLTHISMVQTLEEERKEFIHFKNANHHLESILEQYNYNLQRNAEITRALEQLTDSLWDLRTEERCVQESIRHETECLTRIRQQIETEISGLQDVAQTLKTAARTQENFNVIIDIANNPETDHTS